MLNHIIGFSVRNKLIVGLFTLVLVLYGALELSKLPIDAVPDITNNQVQVITTAPSYGATDIERLVTFPVEQSMSNIAGLSEIRSYSRFGLSLVTIVFDDDTDIYWARQQVSERLQQIRSQIPADIGEPAMGPISTGLGEIYQYVVRPKEGFEHRYTVTELRTIQDWIIRRQLLGVKGVAEVSSFGGKLKQYEVAVNPNKLQALGVTINDVFQALERNNQNTGGAYIEKNAGVLYIRSEGLLTGIEDIGNIHIRQTQNNTALLLRDVADVRIGSATRYGALTYNDKGEVSGAIVMMLKGGNSNLVIADIKTRIGEIQKTLPEGVIIEPFLDRTKMVDNAISTVKTNLMEGALIVVFVLVLFLGNFRAGLLVASVIPLSMLFAIILMNIFGVSGNLMSLGALDFGLIVDGAVIIVEAVMHQVSHSSKFLPGKIIPRKTMDGEVKTAASKMMNSAVFGQIIILIVYLPIFTLEGIEGKMFKPMAQTVAFALLGAFVLSLTYIPMMSTLFLRNTVSDGKNLSDRLMDAVTGCYTAALKRLLRIPGTVISCSIALLLISILVLSRMGGEFIPSIEEGDYAVETRVLAGSSLTTTIENTQKVVAILKSRFPEVEKIVTKIGSSEIPTEPLPMDMGDMIITLKDKSDWTSAGTFEELAEKMTEAAKEVPGVTTSFQFPVQMRFNELMTGARQDVVCKIFGEDLDTLSLYAKKIAAIATNVDGTGDLYVETVSGIPQIVIEYDRSAVAQYGLDITSINQVVNAAFAGQTGGTVFEGEKRFDLVVRLQNENRKSLEDVQQLLIPVPAGGEIPLNQIARVQLKDSPNQIQREDAKRRILVGFNVHGRDVETIVNELRDKVERTIRLPAGYAITYGGAFENLNAAKDRLMVAVPVSLALIFLLLYFAFSSVRQALLIYSAIPLSAIGGIFFLALRGMPFSISAGVGFIALFGIAVLNGIVLIAEFNRIRNTGENDLKAVVVRGTATRLRPVLMTAFVASLGFLPMALSNGAGGEVQRPLATVVIGGLLIATALTLFVLPILYIRFNKGYKVPRKMAVVVALFFCAGFPAAHAQSPITLKSAIDTALSNNLSVKDARLRSDFHRQQIKTAVDLPHAQLTGEFGKFNSPYNDSRFLIEQSSSLPVVYRRKKAVYEAEWQQSKLNGSLTSAMVKKMVTQVYYDLRYLDAKETLLRRMDSIYAEFLRVSKLRFNAGETNILEQASALNQQGSLQLQLNDLATERKAAQLTFATLLNSGKPVVPEPGPLKYFAAAISDTISEDHPELRVLKQQETILEAVTRYERSRLLPEIAIGYTNLSIRDGVRYDISDRFSAVQAGLSLPIFARGQRSRIHAAEINEDISRNNYEKERQMLRQKKQEMIARHQKNMLDLSYFEREGMPNARLINETLALQLRRGEINYIEWTTLTRQALETENAYLDAVKTANDQLIELEYLGINN